MDFQLMDNLNMTAWAHKTTLTPPLYIGKAVPSHVMYLCVTGAVPGFQVRWGALQKIAPSEERRENCWGISCEKSRFYAKKSYFFPILGWARAECAPLPPPTTNPPLC